MKTEQKPHKVIKRKGYVAEIRYVGLQLRPLANIWSVKLLRPDSCEWEDQEFTFLSSKTLPISTELVRQAFLCDIPYFLAVGIANYIQDSEGAVSV